MFSFLPHIPIKFNLWLPDEEFSASGKVLFDASAENDLQIEAAGTAAAICLSLLERVIEQQKQDGHDDKERLAQIGGAALAAGLAAGNPVAGIVLDRIGAGETYQSNM